MSSIGRIFLLLAGSSFLAAAVLVGGEVLNVLCSPFETALRDALRAQYPLLPRLALVFPAGVLWQTFLSYWCVFAVFGLLLAVSSPLWGRWSGIGDRDAALHSGLWALFFTLLISTFGVLVLYLRLLRRFGFFSLENLGVAAVYGAVCLLVGFAAFRYFLRLPEARKRSRPALFFSLAVFLIFPVLTALNRVSLSPVTWLDALVILLGIVGVLGFLGRIPTRPLSMVRNRWRRLGSGVRTASAGVLILVLGAGIALNAPRWTWPELPQGIGIKDRDRMLNVVLVVIDTARADRFSCYGHQPETTPNIDRIAREGVLFENAVSPSNWTLPAHASLFTGLYPTEHQATAEHQFLATEFLTLAEILRGVGYRTAAFSNSPFVGFVFGLAQGFETFHPAHPRVDQKRPPLVYEVVQRRIVGDVVRKGMDLFRSRTPSISYSLATNAEIRRWVGRRGSEPFFLFVNYFDPHFPYRPPDDHREKFFSTRRDEALALRLELDTNRFITGLQQLEQADLARLGRLYDGEISLSDAAVGSLYEILRDEGVLDDTLLVITSDHGEYLGEHGLMEHTLGFHEPALRVPLIMRCPSMIAPGTRLKTLIQNMDLFHTILELVGVEGVSPPRQNHVLDPQADLPAMADGFRFQLAIDELKRANPSFDTSPFDRRTTVIYKGGVKYVEDTNGRRWLYDVISDPAEQRNLVDVNPDLADELRDLLDQYQRTPMVAIGDEEVAVDEDTLRNLRALGYME